MNEALPPRLGGPRRRKVLVCMLTQLKCEQASTQNAIQVQCLSCLPQQTPNQLLTPELIGL